MANTVAMDLRDFADPSQTKILEECPAFPSLFAEPVNGVVEIADMRWRFKDGKCIAFYRYRPRDEDGVMPHWLEAWFA